MAMLYTYCTWLARVASNFVCGTDGRVLENLLLDCHKENDFILN